MTDNDNEGVNHTLLLTCAHMCHLNFAQHLKGMVLGSNNSETDK